MSPSYEREVRHASLKRSRILRGTDPESLRIKAEELLACWDQEWKLRRDREQRESLERLVRETRATSPEQKVALAEEKTAEADREIRKLENLLSDSIGRDTRIQWETLKDYSEFTKPKPIEPVLTQPVLQVPVMPPPPVEPAKPRLPDKPVPPDPSERPSRDDPRFKVDPSDIEKLGPEQTERKRKAAESLYVQAALAWNSKIHAYNESVAKFKESASKLRDTYKSEIDRYHRLRSQHEEQCQRLRIEYEDRLHTAMVVHQNDVIREKAKYQRNLLHWEEERSSFYARQETQNRRVDEETQGYVACNPENVIEYCDMVLSSSEYPESFPQRFDLDYVKENKTLLCDYYLPRLEDLPKIKEWKYVQSRDAIVGSPLSESFREKLFDGVACQIALRVLHELFTADTEARWNRLSSMEESRQSTRPRGKPLSRASCRSKRGRLSSSTSTLLWSNRRLASGS